MYDQYINTYHNKGTLFSTISNFQTNFVENNFAKSGPTYRKWSIHSTKLRQENQA